MTRTTRFRTLRASALFAAAVASVPGPAAVAAIAGFTDGSGVGPTQYTLTGSQPGVAPTIDAGADTLTITTPVNDQAGSAFYNTPQSVTNWTAQFDYTVTSSAAGAATADGLAFVVQNDPRGASARGDGGGALAYGGGTAITNSVAIGIDLYNGNGTTNPTRFGLSAGGSGFNYVDSGALSLRNGQTYRFNIAHSNGLINTTVTNAADPAQTFSRTFFSNVAARTGGPTALVGFTGATGGANAGQTVSNFTFTTGTASVAAPAPAPLITGVPAGGNGFFGVREVTNNNGVGNLTEAEQSIATDRSGTRRVVDYTAPSLDIYDTDNRGNFTNDRPFASAAAPGPGVGNVDNLAMISSGTIRVPTTGYYTFGVKSDDGFRLTVGGQRFEVALGQGGTEVNANGALQFNAGRGAGDISLGQIYLPAGDHPIQVLNWEGGGGASLEVSSAQGVHTGFNGTFNLVGAPAVPEIRVNRARYAGTMGAGDFTVGRVNGVSAIGIDNPSQLGQLLNRIRDERATPGGGAFDAVATANAINYNDLGGGGGNPRTGGSITAPVEPPGGDPAAASDDYGLAATGTINIAAGRTGRYTFNVHADDDSIFRIYGPDGVLVPLVSTNRTAVDTDGDNVPDAHRYDGCCNDSLGRYDLNAAGDYVVEAAFREGDGGSHFQLFGAIGDYNEFGEQFQLIGQDFNDTLSVVTQAGVPAGLQLVPEPGTTSALGLAALGLLGARRRRRAR